MYYIDTQAVKRVYYWARTGNRQLCGLLYKTREAISKIGELYRCIFDTAAVHLALRSVARQEQDAFSPASNKERQISPLLDRAGDLWVFMVPNGYIVTGSSQEESIYTLSIISCNSTQTQGLGMCLGELLSGGELILLNGQLGSGKTTFTQGLARGLQIPDGVSSPTFTLLKEYRRPVSHGADKAEIVPVQSGGRQLTAHNLYHFDLYRLDDPDEIVDLGFEDYFYNPGSGICVIEWADKAEVLWPVERLSICLNVLDEERRSLLFVATGARYCQLLRKFSEENLCDY